ncbi:hypothetical protein LCGC14_0196210 [marine sediment metagenome]|uniref:Uncharacterized protein n=1 Tax=marine sediment metagenome TaxID=412755 RepID=A0A0F9XNL7_9ZZZZ
MATKQNSICLNKKNGKTCFYGLHSNKSDKDIENHWKKDNCKSDLKKEIEK